jgi:hypothetical protein
MKEKLEAKLKELQVGQAQAMANVHAYGGAIQLTQQLLAEVEAEKIGQDVVEVKE